MASQSTSISDLPRTDNQSSNEDIQESMMVNSILQDIENEEEINDVNEDSLQYTIDTSQIPPKIGEELPSIETIQETTNTIFNDIPTGEELSNNSEPNEIDDFLNKKLDEPQPPQPEELIPKSITDKKFIICGIMILSFFLLSLPILNRLIVESRLGSRLSSGGTISYTCIIIKALILGLIYFASSIFI